jgi:crossover junction endodeoxyribonuclease RusA
MQQVNLTFPIPPRINGGYWGFHGHRRFLTKEALEYKNIVSNGVKSQPVRFGDARLSLTLILHFRDRRRSDLDGRVKSIQDALCQAGLYNDDSQIDELIVKRGEIIKGGLCLVKIVAIEQN